MKKESSKILTKKSPAVKIPSGKNVTAGIVLSKNTINNIDYLQKKHEKPNEENSVLDQRLAEANIAVSDPDYVIRWIMKSLSERFGTSVIYDNNTDLIKSQPDVTALIDMRFELVDWGA